MICHGDLHPRNVLVERRPPDRRAGLAQHGRRRAGIRRGLHPQHPALRAAGARVGAAAAARAGPPGPADPGLAVPGRLSAAATDAPPSGWPTTRSPPRCAHWCGWARAAPVTGRAAAGPARSLHVHDAAAGPRGPASPGSTSRCRRRSTGHDKNGAMSWRIGVDIGGTFTDVVVADEASGTLAVVKVPTTPRDFAQGVLDGAAPRRPAQHGVRPADVALLAHATTVVTNALLEGKGARTALRHDAGLPRRAGAAPLGPRQPLRPLPGRARRAGAAPRAPRGTRAPGRPGPGGARRWPWRTWTRAVDFIRRHEVEAVAVCFLFSFLNDTHERARGRARCARRCPACPSFCPARCCRRSASSSAPAPPRCAPMWDRSWRPIWSGWRPPSPAWACRRPR